MIQNYVTAMVQTKYEYFMLFDDILKYICYIEFNGKVFIKPGIRREGLKKNMKYVS